MRGSALVKLFIFCISFAVLTFIYMSFQDFKKYALDISYNRIYKDNSNVISELSTVNLPIKYDDTSTEAKSDLKYILQWTSPKNVPFVYMGKGQEGFYENKCAFTNCYVTSDRNYLGDYTKFDVIAFAGTEVVYYQTSQLPKKRSPHQKFVFASIESGDNYPICSNRLDNFFNWTWTYKLDSESRWGYIIVRDNKDVIIGPQKEMHWMKIDEMDPVTEDFKAGLKSKKKAAAWFVSNCVSRSRRGGVAKELKKELEQYGLEIDVYGNCGDKKCGRDKEEECDKMLEKEYYFYLSFENSFSEDYVTEKLLHALNFNTVPIVYGGANYTRFMPDGIYLDIKKLGAKKVAETMNELILDLDKYADYFKWQNHYKYHRRNIYAETNDYCGFCELLNKEEKLKETSVYQNFKEWWTPPGRC